MGTSEHMWKIMVGPTDKKWDEQASAADKFDDDLLEEETCQLVRLAKVRLYIVS